MIMFSLIGPIQQIQQRVQIIRGPDGKLQVRGLMPGQQLVQMPDGKLHVLNNSQTITTVAQTGGTTTQVKLLTNILIWYITL